MKNIKIKLKRKALKNNTGIKDTLNSFIQPFKEMPSANDSGKENAGRINAHDLFSLYTADIIREETVYFR